MQCSDITVNQRTRESVEYLEEQRLSPIPEGNAGRETVCIMIAYLVSRTTAYSPRYLMMLFTLKAIVYDIYAMK